MTSGIPLDKFPKYSYFVLLCFANLVYNKKHDSSIMSIGKTNFEKAEGNRALSQTHLSRTDSIIFPKNSIIFAER